MTAAEAMSPTATAPFNYGAPTASDFLHVREAVLEDGTFHIRLFWRDEIMLKNPYPAQVIEEREILQDEVIMRQIRPAMIAIERGTFLDVGIPHTRTTRPDSK